ncbi:NAD(P)-binding protein [Stipitochalara longipes BDJ]|nr:NAD(P)-binding protein [Stipitochalara longipes BDJ]
MAPQSTIIITGGTGSLGSSLARTLETSYPGRFHLLLTCRTTDDEHAKAISTFLSSKNGSFALEKLDLSDLDAVKAFTENVKSRIANGELKPLIGGGVVNSAAYSTFFKGRKAKGGLDIMYTINCLAPTLLMRGLSDAMIKGATFINVGSAAHEIGRTDYFEGKEEGEVKEGEKLAFMEGMKRYGSSKLLGMMLGYAFQRRVFAAYPENKLHVINLDPGSMNAGGRLLGNERHWVFPILYGILGTLGPVLRLVKKDAINPPSVPAKAIADLFGSPKESEEGVWKTGKLFVLDDEKKSNALSLNEAKQDEVWKNVSRDLGLEESLKK